MTGVREHQTVVHVLLAYCIASFEYAADREAAASPAAFISQPGELFVASRVNGAVSRPPIGGFLSGDPQ